MSKKPKVVIGPSPKIQEYKPDFGTRLAQERAAKCQPRLITMTSRIQPKG